MVTTSHSVSTDSLPKGIGIPSSQHLHGQLFPDTHSAMTGACAKHLLKGHCLHFEGFSCSQRALIAGAHFVSESDACDRAWTTARCEGC